MASEAMYMRLYSPAFLFDDRDFPTAPLASQVSPHTRHCYVVSLGRGQFISIPFTTSMPFIWGNLDEVCVCCLE